VYVQSAKCALAFDFGDVVAPLLGAIGNGVTPGGAKLGKYKPCALPPLLREILQPGDFTPAYNLPIVLLVLLVLFVFTSLAMGLLNLTSPLYLTYVGVACIGGYWLYSELTTGKRRRQFIKKHGCKPALRFKTKDPIFGLDMFFAFNKWVKNHRSLENIDREYFRSGSVGTIESQFFRYFFILTVEPENIKTVLSTNFKTFGIIQPRADMKLLLGQSIFVTEGAEWHQSRELLRPCFARSQVADLNMLEKHVTRMVEQLPKDGATVDLAPHFFRLTLDIAVEFLFGDNTSSGNGSNEDILDNDAFARVWDAMIQDLLDTETNSKFWVIHTILDLIRINPRFKRHFQAVHSTCNIYSSSL
jgi:Cytochrome P450